MNKNKARKFFLTYLKEHNITHQEIVDGDYCIYLVFHGYERSPDHVIECSIRFSNIGIVYRAYYTESAKKWIFESDDLSNLYILLNYCNSSVWPFNIDGANQQIYRPHYLATPRFVLTEDKDLTSVTMVDYDIFELAPLEITDYFTKALPELMDMLSIPLLAPVLKIMTLEEAIDFINREMKEKKY